jgi:hypothetical protein
MQHQNGSLYFETIPVQLKEVLSIPKSSHKLGEINLEIDYQSGEIPRDSSKLSIKSFLHINEDEDEPRSPSATDVFKSALHFMKNLSPVIHS